jgi:hypothetical protein
MLSTNDTDLILTPNTLYFNSYQTLAQQVKAIVSSYAVNKSVLVTIEHEESGGFDLFRYTTPIVVNLTAGKL